MLAFAAGSTGAWAHRVPGTSAVKAVPHQVKEAAKDVKDFWIKTKIHSQFAMADELEGSNIDVDITHGAVTLNGTVASAAGKTKAETIARGTDGVKSVTNNLTIGAAEKAIDPQKVREAGRNVGRMVTDGYVKSAIFAKFLMEKSLEDSDINIDVKNGVVTLKGTVPTETGRAKAEEVARHTAGVKSVNNTLRIG
jgi:hyperosmotically inducible protein